MKSITEIKEIAVKTFTMQDILRMYERLNESAVAYRINHPHTFTHDTVYAKYPETE
jgi:hypothetical protein